MYVFHVPLFRETKERNNCTPEKRQSSTMRLPDMHTTIYPGLRSHRHKVMVLEAPSDAVKTKWIDCLVKILQETSLAVSSWCCAVKQLTRTSLI